MRSEIAILRAKINYAQNKIAPERKAKFCKQNDGCFQNAYLKQKSAIVLLILCGLRL